MEVAKAIPIAQLRGIKGHFSYHGCISSREAKEKLSGFAGNCYLTRFSPSMQLYFLVVKYRAGDNFLFQQFQIDMKFEGTSCTYKLDGAFKSFGDCSEMFCFYQSNPINYDIHDIGRCISTPQAATFPSPPVH